MGETGSELGAVWERSGREVVGEAENQGVGVLEILEILEGLEDLEDLENLENLEVLEEIHYLLLG